MKKVSFVLFTTHICFIVDLLKNKDYQGLFVLWTISKTFISLESGYCQDNRNRTDSFHRG